MEKKEGVESFRKEASKNSEGLEWRENGRRYSLELRKNDGGQFILCSIANLDGKWHRLSFPEGNGLINGWTLLEEALQALGTMENRGEKSKPVKSTSLGKAETDEEGQNQDLPSVETTIHGRENQDTIWLDINESIPKGNLGLLKYGMVGGWKSQQVADPPLTELEAWAKRAWRMKGSVLFNI